MKRICYITTISATIQSFILKSSKYLHDHGDYDITFICNPDDEFAVSLPEYIHFIPLKMERGVSLSGFQAILALAKIFKQEKFDLIQYSTPNASAYASIAGFLAGVPVRLYCQWGLAFEGFTGIKRSIFKCIEKNTCLLSTWIEPDSYGNLERCRNAGFYPATKSSVVGNGSACGINLQKFDVSKKSIFRSEIRNKYRISDDTFVFGFVGSITGDKGTNELLYSARELSNKYSNIILMLIGAKEKEGSLDAELMSWSRNCPNIIYCGRSDRVEAYMSAMDCYVMPSYREGFGMTVIEAGAMKLPVICTDIPGPTDAIKDGYNGLIVKKKDVESLKNAMETMLNDPELCREYGENGYTNVKEKYDQKVLFPAILEDRRRLLKLKQET